MGKKFVLGLLTGMMVLTLAAADLARAEGNQVFFRGGWAALSTDRGNEIFTDLNSAGGVRNSANSGYYYGAGLDLLMHKNFLGVNGMSLVGELGLEYNRYAKRKTTSTAAVLAGVASVNQEVPITQLIVDVSPKLRFREGSGVRPWIIPIGLDFIVNSPPSNFTTYLDSGLEWGVGTDITLWGPINLGLDARYHMSFHESSQNSFGSLGAYVGIAF